MTNILYIQQKEYRDLYFRIVFIAMIITNFMAISWYFLGARNKDVLLGVFSGILPFAFILYLIMRLVNDDRATADNSDAKKPSVFGTTKSGFKTASPKLKHS